MEDDAVAGQHVHGQRPNPEAVLRCSLPGTRRRLSLPFALKIAVGCTHAGSTDSCRSRTKRVPKIVPNEYPKSTQSTKRVPKEYRKNNNCMRSWRCGAARPAVELSLSGRYMYCSPIPTLVPARTSPSAGGTQAPEHRRWTNRRQW